MTPPSSEPVDRAVRWETWVADPGNSQSGGEAEWVASQRPMLRLSSSVTPGEKGVGGRVTERNPHLFGLGSIDVVAENPTSRQLNIALNGHPDRIGSDHTPKYTTWARGRRIRHCYRCTDFFHGTGSFVAEDPSRSGPGKVALFRMWRSLPQMVVASTRTMASVLSIGFGSRRRPSSFRSVRDR